MPDKKEFQIPAELWKKACRISQEILLIHSDLLFKLKEENENLNNCVGMHRDWCVIFNNVSSKLCIVHI